MCDRERWLEPQAAFLIAGGVSCIRTVPKLVSICGRLTRGPKAVPVLIPRTCGYATLQGRKDSADVIKLRTLSWGDYPGLSERAQYNQRGPLQGGRRVRPKEDVTTKQRERRRCDNGDRGQRAARQGP